MPPLTTMPGRLPAKALFAFAAGLVAIAAYLPGLHGGFALDDYTNVVQNPAVAIQDFSWDSLSHAMFSFQAGPAMRPVSMLSFALNAYFTGTDGSMAFKATNLAIHLVNGCLVAWLLVQLLSAYCRLHAPSLPERPFGWLAALTAAFWLLHPLNAMPVLYIVQRETSLSSLFVLLGLNAYICSRERMLRGHSGAWMLWTLVPLATLVAVLCKESGALLPVYALAIECFIFRFRSAAGGFDRRTAAFYGLFLLLPGCAGLAWMLLAHHGGFLDYSGRDFGLGERLLSETRVVWLYIRWTLMPYPSELGLYHDDILPSRGLLEPATTLLSIVGLTGLTVAAALLRRRLPLVALGIAWFLGGQLMESTIFPLELAYEHRCYLPDLGLLLAVLSLVFPLRADAPWRLGRYSVLALAFIACTAFTWTRAHDWRDNLPFAAAEARHHPLSPYATYMLGQTYANLALMEDKDEYTNAVSTLRTASEVPRSTVIPDVSLVLVQAQLKGRVDPDVLPRIARKVSDRKLGASDIQGLAALGECVDKGNSVVEPADMQAIFDSALANPYLTALRDTHANILVIYGNYTATSLRDVGRARELMVQAAALVPSEAQYQENIVTMDISLRDAALARRDLEVLQRLNYFGHLDPVIADLRQQVDSLPAPKGAR
jgi:hypothetical protein